jgi:hypothetical protein
MEKEIIQEKKVYKAKYQETNKIICKNNRNKRIQYLLDNYQIKDTEIDLEIYECCNEKEDLCICGHLINQTFIINIKYNNCNLKIQLGNKCITYFKNGKKTLQKFLRKKFYCQTCDKNVYKQIENINGDIIKHTCNYTLCKSCKIKTHHTKYKKCYYCLTSYNSKLKCISCNIPIQKYTKCRDCYFSKII